MGRTQKPVLWGKIMEAYIKEKLEERNNRIIEAVIKKAESVCPGAIALIGIAGSFHSSDIYEKSDLDLCIVINDDSGRKIASCFILGDAAFDIYCTPWSRLEEMAEYNNPYITKLLEMDIVYCSDDRYMQKYMELRAKVTNKLNQAYSIEDNNKAEKFVGEASREYANIMLSDRYGETRYAAAGMLYYIEFAIYMYNKAYVRRGIKRIPEEISTMKYLPAGFNELYSKLINAGNVEEIKETSTMLMKAVKAFSKQMKDKVITKKEISEADIKGTYEEIYSNWRNKMYHAADIEDAYLSLMTAASCQNFYDEMYSEYNIDKINLMENIMNHSGSQSRLVSSLKNLAGDPRFAMSALPAIIGLLPSMGGARFSAPLVEEAAKDVPAAPEQKAVINYYFRHIWEYSLPVYSANLLAIETLKVPTAKFITVMLPFTLATYIIGFLLFKGIKVPNNTIEKKSSAKLWFDIFEGFLPIVTVVLLVLILGWNILTALFVVVSIMLIYYKVPLSKLGAMLQNSLAPKLLYMILGAIYLRDVLEQSGSINLLLNYFKAGGLNPLLIALILPFLISLLTGMTIAGVTITLPMISTIVPPDQIHNYGCLAFVCNIIGSMLSPMHLCLIMSTEHFSADFGKTFRYLFVPETLLAVFSILYCLFIL
jgi:integral membrane protein (TIGR00529 family)